MTDERDASAPVAGPGPHAAPDLDEETRASRLGHWVRRGVALALVVAVAAAVALWARSDRSRPEPEAPPGPQGPIPVHVVVVRREAVPIAPRFLGQAAASQVVEIRARVAGYIVERAFTEGTQVDAGQLLFQIDPRPFELELAEARARLAAAEARQAEATLQLRRFQELRGEGTVTRAEVEEQQKEQAVAAAEVELTRAQIESAELRLEYASIESPLRGIVGEALLHVGSYVDGLANTPIAVVQQVDPLYVRYAVTERDLLRWQQQAQTDQLAAEGGLELEVTLGDGSVHPHRGRLDFISPELSPSTGTALARGVIPNPDFTLRPGQFVHVTVLGLRRTGVIRVPQSAVQQAPAGPRVLVVGPRERVEARAVELGEWLGEEAWIVERGLRPGDRVVVDRLLTLRPGMPVVVLPAAEEAAAGPEGAPGPTPPERQPAQQEAGREPG